MFWKRKHDAGEYSRGLDYVERLDLMAPKIEQLALLLHAIKADTERLHQQLDAMDVELKALSQLRQHLPDQSLKLKDKSGFRPL